MFKGNSQAKDYIHTTVPRIILTSLNVSNLFLNMLMTLSSTVSPTSLISKIITFRILNSRVFLPSDWKFCRIISSVPSPVQRWFLSSSALPDWQSFLSESFSLQSCMEVVPSLWTPSLVLSGFSSLTRAADSIPTKHTYTVAHQYFVLFLSQ